MVEILVKRGELLPSDESIEQHQKKRAEEISDVDKDRNSSDGLFKGTFPPGRRELIYDDGDGVLRCPRCLTEHEGGPTCANCHLPVEESNDFSDMDGDEVDGDDLEDLDDLESLELDLDAEIGHGHHHHPHFMIPTFRFGGRGPPFHGFHHPAHHGRIDYDSDESDDYDSDMAGDMDEEEDEDEGSIGDFVVADDQVVDSHNGNANANDASQQEPITISDDDSDEGGAISNRRRRRLDRTVGSSSPSVQSAVSVTSTNRSEVDEAVMLQNAGWSPLDQDSDAENHAHYPLHEDGESEEENTDDNSDTETETMVGNGPSDDDDDDDDESRNDLSSTPRYEYPFHGAGSVDSEDEDGDGEDDNSEAGIMDQDGDTEMSVSPSSRSVSVSNEYYGFAGNLESRGPSVEPHSYGHFQSPSRSRESESVSVESGYGYNRGENLGAANQIQEIDDDSDASSVIAPPGRRPRRSSARPQVNNYDPRLSSLFAEHQQSRQTVQNQQSGFGDLNDEYLQRRPPYVQPRQYAIYRGQPPAVIPHRFDPMRGSRSSSATRLVSSTRGRRTRQYRGRN